MGELKIIKNLKYIYPIISSVLALWFVSLFNIMKFFSFVPTKHRFNVCLALYLTIIQNLFALLDKCLEIKIRKRLSELQVVFYDYEKNKNIKFEPVITLDTVTGVGEVKCSINVHGSANLLNNIELIIKFPKWVEVQPSIKECKLKRLENDSAIHIYLKDLTINNSNEKSTIDFKLPMLINHVSGRREHQIKCEYRFINNKKSKLYFKYSSNNFKLVSEAM